MSSFLIKVEAAFNAAKTSEKMIQQISTALNKNADKWIDVYFRDKEGKDGEVQFAMGEALQIVQKTIQKYKVTRLTPTPMVNLGLDLKKEEAVTAAPVSDFAAIVERMSKGETVTMSEDDYEKLIDYLDKTDHKYSLKLASLWNKADPKKLDAFFKGLPKLH